MQGSAASYVALALLIGPWGLFAFTYLRYRKVARDDEEKQERIERLGESVRSLREHCARLEPYSQVADVHAEIARATMQLRLDTERTIAEAQGQAQKIISDAKDKADAIASETNEQLSRSTTIVLHAQTEAERIVQGAREKAKSIADAALEAKANAELYERTATAMQNAIQGYGNDWLVPSRSLLDDLAETYGYTQASQDYKSVRETIRKMVKEGLAADCDYAEDSRRRTAIAFVIDAFNGKVDTILASAKADNFGTLKQKLIDAYALVNANGKAFRDARVTEKYFSARMEELRLACVLNEIRKRDIEEQRRIREQIREEEKVRREIEKAIRDSQKEEEMLQKAMEKARAQLEQANEEQRAAYEAQVAELEKKLKDAEERSQRAESMAEKTKKGHVYIISNVGSFGDGVYKIGMTRRLDPLDRIKELSNASVPFAFDVHALIWSDDAPALEHQLHERFALSMVNKVNFRKEFFRIPLSDIRAELEKDAMEIKWTMAAEAAEYRETLAIEKKIADDPEARDAWLGRQMEIEEAAPLSIDDDEEEGPYDLSTAI